MIAFFAIGALVFLAGFVLEVAYLAWLYCADCGWPLRTAGMAMLVGTLSLAGFAAAIERPQQAPFLIIGYGVGSYFAAKMKQRGQRT